MTGRDNLHIVKSAYDEYMDLFDKYSQAFHLHHDALIEADEKYREGKIFDEKETAYVGFKPQMIGWSGKMEQELQDQLDNRSNKSHVSSKTHKSGSSIRSERLKHKAKIAELTVKKQMVEQARQLAEDQAMIKVKLEKEHTITKALIKAKQEQEQASIQAKLKAEEDTFKLDMEISMARAREGVYMEEEGIIL